MILSAIGMCSSPARSCTPADGLRPIEEIEAGDLVLSRDEATGEQTWKPVLDTVVTRPRELYTLCKGVRNLLTLR